MILQIDAGNTRVNWRVQTGSGRSDVSGVFDYLGLPDWPRGAIERVELASVAAKDRHEWLLQRIRENFDVPVQEAATAARQNGLVNSYAQPDAMGVDRWLAMLGAHGRWGGGFAVVDAGTAITVDYVDVNGVHLGGYILPGSRLVLQSLNQETGRVRAAEELGLQSTPGHTTAECVHNGLAWSLAALMQRVADDCRNFSLSYVVMTGGDGERLHSLFPGEAVYAPHLVLDGMDLYWGREPT